MTMNKSFFVYVSVETSTCGVISGHRKEVIRIKGRKKLEVRFLVCQVIPSIIVLGSCFFISGSPIVFSHITQIIRIIGLRDGKAVFLKALDDVLRINDVFPVHSVQIRRRETVQDLILGKRKGIAVSDIPQVIRVTVFAGVLSSVSCFDPALGRNRRVFVPTGFVISSCLRPKLRRGYSVNDILIGNVFSPKAGHLFEFG